MFCCALIMSVFNSTMDFISMNCALGSYSASEHSMGINIYCCYYYYCYYLLQLSFHSVAVVLTLVTNKNKYT
jgi:hypothetical protein